MQTSFFSIPKIHSVNYKSGRWGDTMIIRSKLSQYILKTIVVGTRFQRSVKI